MNLSDPHVNVRIPAGMPFFKVSFVATDFINVENYEYAYRLEGYDSSWIELQKQNEVSFSYLPYGDYELHVKYKNDVFHSDVFVYTLPITVLPPWYLSRLAWIIYVLLFLICVYITFLLVRRRIERRQLQVARRIKEEEKEKLYVAKLNFFTNITH